MTHPLLVPYSHPNELETNALIPLTEGRICLLKVELIHNYIECVIMLGTNNFGPLATWIIKRVLDYCMHTLCSIWQAHKKTDGCN
jgi:hypothetical protein